MKISSLTALLVVKLFCYYHPSNKVARVWYIRFHSAAVISMFSLNYHVLVYLSHATALDTLAEMYLSLEAQHHIPLSNFAMS